jgi:CBS domain-containing protein
MSGEVVTVSEETALAEIAALLEKHGIKRVPVVREGRLVGIVSRADLLRGLATRGFKPMTPVTPDDVAIRAQILELLQREPWAGAHFLSIVVDHGVVHFWGLVYSEAERDALRVAAENIPGVQGVKDHLRLWRRVGL